MKELSQEQLKILDETIRMIGKWIIEARRDELVASTKKFMREQKPVDTLELLNIVKDRVKKLNKFLGV